jgi:hypothetical protein
LVCILSIPNFTPKAFPENNLRGLDLSEKSVDFKNGLGDWKISGAEGW